MILKKIKVDNMGLALVARCQTIETVDMCFRDIMDVDESFDGKVIIF